MALKDRPNVTELTCDALITGFLPSQPIRVVYNKSFYIPSAGYAEEIIQGAIRQIKKGNKRVLENAYLATHSRKDCDSFLRSWYLSTYQNPLLEHEDGVSGLGPLFRYREGERKKAIERALNFWNSKEMECFGQIHQVMRKETKDFFKRRNI